jgi:adenosylhomocysteine nucleosidase
MICVQICATNEWEAFRKIKGFPVERFLTYPYGTYVEENIKGLDCIFYLSKATKTRSAGACQYAIDNWNPKRIILLGTAGGVSTQLKNLDLVVASRTGQYDCIEGMGAENDFFYEIFNEELDNNWIDFSKLPPRTFQGLIATADQDVGFLKAEELRKYDVLAADWESGSISHICNLNNVPCCIIRGVSDVPKSDDPEDIKNQREEFIKNTPIIMEILLIKVLPALLSMDNI